MTTEPHEDIVNSTRINGSRRESGRSSEHVAAGAFADDYLCRHCSAGAFVDKARVMVSHDFFCPLYSLNHRIRNATVM